ncbi:MAG: ABC transporter substrate binding protein [Archangium sp.]|nr:ABC transporter substrate binding protein [Archangium sp.]
MSRLAPRIALFFVAVVSQVGLGAGSGQVLLVRSSDQPAYKAVAQAFIVAMGRQVTVLNLVTHPDEVRRVVGEVPSLVVAVGPDAARAIAELKTTAPVLNTMVPEPEKLGPAEALRTVPMFIAPSRQLQVMKEFLPSARRLGVMYDPKHSQALVDELSLAAEALGLTVVRQEVQQTSEVASAVRKLLGRVDALWLVPDATLIDVDTFKFLVQTSLESKIPLIGFSQGMAKAGALLAVEADYGDMGIEAAALGLKQLSGTAASPGFPKGRVYLNGRTAGVLDITIPAAARSQARAVF